MVQKASGSAVNPAFIQGYNRLKYAKANYDAAKLTGDNNACKTAEGILKQAEAYFCNQKGLSDKGGDMTKEHALAIVDSYMNDVHSWYA